MRELIAQLDGRTGAKAGQIVAVAALQRALCKDVTQKQAMVLLVVVRNHANPVRPIRLGATGAELFPQFAYAHARGTANFGSSGLPAEIPFVRRGQG